MGEKILNPYPAGIFAIWSGCQHQTLLLISKQMIMGQVPKMDDEVHLRNLAG